MNVGKILLIPLFFVSILCYPQQETANLSTDTANSTESGNLTKNDYYLKYNVVNKTGVNARMVGSGELHETPDPKSNTIITINDKEVVKAIKYFPENRCWLIEYKDFIGFINVTQIMAISSNEKTDYKSQWDVPPRIKTSIKPKYTKEMKDAGLEGIVELKIFINEKGVVTKTIIMKGIDGLNNAAIDAINKAKFEPARKDGKKVEVWVPMRIKF